VIASQLLLQLQCAPSRLLDDLSTVAVTIQESVPFNRFGQHIHTELSGAQVGYAWPPRPRTWSCRGACRGHAARPVRPVRQARQARQPGVLLPQLADPVGAHPDRFRVEYAVAAPGTLPDARPAQFGGEHRRVGTGMTQLIADEFVQVRVGHEPRTTAHGRNHGSQHTKRNGPRFPSRP